jgi:outer membrane biosynthesis protein TonB
LLATEAPETVEGSDVVVRVRQNPDYPRPALTSGLHGWVQIEFDITDMGAVENLHAVASSEAVLGPAAIAAV